MAEENKTQDTKVTDSSCFLVAVKVSLAFPCGNTPPYDVYSKVVSLPRVPHKGESLWLYGSISFKVQHVSFDLDKGSCGVFHRSKQPLDKDELQDLLDFGFESI